MGSPLVDRATHALSVLGRGELVRVTVGCTADALVAGSAAGRFPSPRSSGARLVPWFAPRTRAVLRAEEIHLGQTVRRHLRRNPDWTTSLDEAFHRVVEHCADRASTWITPGMRESFAELHRRGLAHSLEVWNGRGELVGGTFGLQTGGLMSADSMFHTENHASKIALADLAGRVRAAGGVGIDCQYLTPHTEALGARTIDRAAFGRLLREARTLRVVLPGERLPAARLLDPRSPDAPGLPVV